jgi:protoheme IX farnesyltransferase
MPSQAVGAANLPGVVFELTKVRITAAVTFTTATGYVLAAHRIDGAIWLPLVGVFVLACGSAALNQWQERAIDARMSRTRGRPIPSGRIDPAWALFLSVGLILAGLFLLSSVKTNATALLILGIVAIFWYNGVYTYLKRITAFAVVPGALIGAIPPCMGYAAAGGTLFDTTILLVALFFFIWQIPHFWLLLLMLGHEYEAAGLPTVTEKLAEQQLGKITFTWILAAAAAGLAFPASGQIAISWPWRLAIVLAAVWLAAHAVKLLRPQPDQERAPSARRAFGRLNIFALIVMICLSFGALTG